MQEISNFDSENDEYHWYGSKGDLTYKNIHPDVVKAFMASKKVRKVKIAKELFSSDTGIAKKL